MMGCEKRVRSTGAAMLSNFKSRARITLPAQAPSTCHPGVTTANSHRFVMGHSATIEYGTYNSSKAQVAPAVYITKKIAGYLRLLF
jgi:hypothetical protein